MWRLLHCDIWRDGGSYSATLTDGTRHLTYVLPVVPWNDPRAPRAYGPLRVVQGAPRTGQGGLAADARALAALRAADTDGASDATRTRFAEMLARITEHATSWPQEGTPSPDTWTERTAHAVGGLAAVGFDASGRYVLVASWQGRGVIDCHTGERVARDADDSWSWFRNNDATCEGIGVLAGMRIAMYGVGGGVDTERALPLTAPDGTQCAVHPTEPGWGVTLVVTRAGRECLRAPVDELRALGFSPDFRTLIAAESGTLRIFTGEGV